MPVYASDIPVFTGIWELRPQLDPVLFRVLCGKFVGSRVGQL